MKASGDSRMVFWIDPVSSCLHALPSPPSLPIHISFLLFSPSLPPSSPSFPCLAFSSLLPAHYCMPALPAPPTIPYLGDLGPFPYAFLGPVPHMEGRYIRAPHTFRFFFYLPIIPAPGIPHSTGTTSPYLPDPCLVPFPSFYLPDPSMT